MIEMLHNEARKLLVEGYEAKHDAKEMGNFSTSADAYYQPKPSKRRK